MLFLFDKWFRTSINVSIWHAFLHSVIQPSGIIFHPDRIINKWWHKATLKWCQSFMPHRLCIYFKHACKHCMIYPCSICDTHKSLFFFSVFFLKVGQIIKDVLCISELMVYKMIKSYYSSFTGMLFRLFIVTIGNMTLFFFHSGFLALISDNISFKSLQETCSFCIFFLVIFRVFIKIICFEDIGWDKKIKFKFAKQHWGSNQHPLVLKTRNRNIDQICPLEWTEM